jgi:lipopolysaccharide assembly LptE-like protein
MNLLCKQWALLVLALGVASCGYHVAGHTSLLPDTIHTIAIPAFLNVSNRYKLTDQLPEAIKREFIARTKYKFVSDPNQADAVLKGAVGTYSSYPILFDELTGRAAAVQVNVTLQVRLEERATGKILFNRPAFQVHDQYQISLDPGQYFEESDTALARASKAAAQQLVTAILENF